MSTLLSFVINKMSPLPQYQSSKGCQFPYSNYSMQILPLRVTDINCLSMLSELEVYKMMKHTSVLQSFYNVLISTKNILSFAQKENVYNTKKKRKNKRDVQILSETLRCLKRGCFCSTYRSSISLLTLVNKYNS